MDWPGSRLLVLREPAGHATLATDRHTRLRDRLDGFRDHRPSRARRGPRARSSTAKVILTSRSVGRSTARGATSYWLFEPADPTPESAPVVVFHHGWLAVNPGVYGAWIDHLVRSGRIVIFPRYQDDWPPCRPTSCPTRVIAVRDAFDVLETSPRHVRPDRARFALIGHSAGGNLSAQLAAVARDIGLPVPRAVVVHDAGRGAGDPRARVLAEIPATTLLVVAAAEDDLIVGDHRARQIFAGATAIPNDRKKYVLYRTDRHGSPAPGRRPPGPDRRIPGFRHR